MSQPLPKAGDLVQVTRAASVQFTKPIMCRVIRVLDWITYDGWCWLDVYQLDDQGDAVLRRSIFVRPAGLRIQRATPTPRQPRRPNTRPNAHPDPYSRVSPTPERRPTHSPARRT
ncbi:hypothetical protein [Micromonospora yangpuensis]|uniref:hypothetical protein n=1 Tax=Micromonospora yangpuensis TaxID=683228 RepID=UPI0035A237B5